MKSQTVLSLPVSYHLVLILPLVRKEGLSILIKCVAQDWKDSSEKWKGYGFRTESAPDVKL